MSAPTEVPLLTAGTGSGGTEGTLIPYVTKRHKIGDTIVHESNPVGGLPVDFNGASHKWGNLPTSDPEERATHVVGYLKRNDAVAREVFEIPMGSATFEENVPALSWGKQISFRRGIPPACRFAIPFHRRMFYAGDLTQPWNVWWSEQDEPESVSEDNFLPTLDKDSVTAIGRANENQLVTFSRRQMYEVLGFRGGEFGVAADFEMHKIDSSIGCISHHGLRNIHDRLVFPAEKGIAVYDGAPRYISLSVLRDYWFDDYPTKIEAYENSWAVDDDVESVYLLFIRQPTSPTTFYYVVNYQDIEPSTGTPQLGTPRFEFDRRAREDSASSMMALEGTNLRKRYTASCDGQIREENVRTNADDDGDAWQKKAMWQPRHDFYEDVGGDRWHGKFYTDFGLLMENENNAATLTFYPGDDSAVDGSPPAVRGTCTVPAGAVAGKVSRQDFFLRPYLAGQGLSFRVEVLSPLNVEYAGNYGAWKEGLQTRPKTP